MEQNTLGIMLSYYRDQYGLSMEQVCEGICSVASIHRVECGSREIDSLMGETLLGRLGKRANEFEMMLGDEDYAYWQVRTRLLMAMKRKDYKTAQREAAAYRQLSEGLPKVHRQFCLYYEGILAIGAHETREKICALFAEAFYCTREEIRHGQLYSPIEINTALKLIHYRYPAWEGMYKSIIDELLLAVERCYTGQEKEDMQVEIWLERIYLAKEQDNDPNLLRYIDDAIDAAVGGRRMKHLGELYFQKAQVLERRFHAKAEWGAWEHKCRKECLMAYYVFEATRKTEEQKEIQIFCREKLRWHITGQEKLFD